MSQLPTIAATCHKQQIHRELLHLDAAQSCQAADNAALNQVLDTLLTSFQLAIATF